MKTTKTLAILVLALGLAAEVAKADFTFGTPTNLGPPVNTSAGEFSPHISADGLSLYFASDRPGQYGVFDLWLTTRPTQDNKWEEPVNLGPTVNSSAFEAAPCISADGLSLFFCDGAFGVSVPHRPGGYGNGDIWVSTRATKEEQWDSPKNLGPIVNGSARDLYPFISADGLSLFFSSDRPGGYGEADIWITTRATMNSSWDTPRNLGPIVNSSVNETAPCISSNGLWLLFTSNRPPGAGHDGNLWVTTRRTISDPWQAPIYTGPQINSLETDSGPRLSPDGSTLYFFSDRAGGLGYWEIWQAPILLVVDFNGDGIVDSTDMCIMVDHWHTDDPSCDIGPAPLGDGIVDVQDLIVLAEHFFEEVNDPTLVAHWALDEIKGDIASDSANDNDCTVYGDPAWQPEGGMVDGALQFDGIDDYVSTDPVLSPSDGKFSVLTWVKGGAPGQVVLSQMGGARWLCADPSEGNLMTELKASGRGGAELLSQAIITDGNWHRIGLVWDGSHKTLYVDDVAVAEDAQANLEGSDNGLYIGTGKAMETGSFWSGLIDDVRIYNRAVIP